MFVRGRFPLVFGAEDVLEFSSWFKSHVTASFMADALYFVGKTAWYVWYAHKRFPLRASRMVGLGLVVFLRLLLLALPLLLLLKLLLALLEALLLACWCGVVGGYDRLKHFPVMAVVLKNISHHLYLLFFCLFGRADAFNPAQFPFKGGNNVAGVLARLGLYSEISVCGLPVDSCCYSAIGVTFEVDIQKT